ncbi:unnamed protein product [Meloidogyne enterolobii]|uniref:Uncharacterized protein n=1 Tax=Meloidogyne enterolobii TaxID=390850 RepID=A0ACB0YS59_MELEN
MFSSLPAETKLDIFKFLNYQQLCLVKQTNLYFREFIDKYEGEFAREKFYDISIVYFDQYKGRLHTHKLIKPKIENFDFPLNERFEEKWKHGLENPIHLYLSNRYSDKNAFCLIKVRDFEERYLLHLPTIIKNKDDLKIVYYYLNKLFNCSFQRCYFGDFFFNPELIQLLFGRVPKQFYIQDCDLFISAYTIQNIFKFILNNLVGELLRVDFLLDDDITEKYINILFKIIINGDKFRKINLKIYICTRNFDRNMNVATLYDQIVEYMATSSDCSKMMSVIVFDFSTFTSLRLSERAEKVRIQQLDDTKYTDYQIVNIHNPKVRFSFCNEEKESFSGFDVKIEIRKEQYFEVENNVFDLSANYTNIFKKIFQFFFHLFF